MAWSELATGGSLGYPEPALSERSVMLFHCSKMVQGTTRDVPDPSIGHSVQFVVLVVVIIRFRGPAADLARGMCLPSTHIAVGDAQQLVGIVPGVVVNVPVLWGGELCCFWCSPRVF